MDIMDTYGAYALLGSLVILYVILAAIAIWEYWTRRNDQDENGGGSDKDN